MVRYHCENGLPTWIYDELRCIQDVAYKYDDEQPPEDFVEALAEELAPANNLPPERLLDGSSLLFEYDPAAIKVCTKLFCFRLWCKFFMEVLSKSLLLFFQDLAGTYFTPSNARLDMASTTFGRSADYEHMEPSSGDQGPLPPSDQPFDATKTGTPQREPVFGTHYWVQELSNLQLQEWSDLAKPQLPHGGSLLHLPQENPYIPTKFSTKPLPPADDDHPLLNCSIKLQIIVGKRKQWFAATVTQFNSIKNQILLSYEDEEEKWHQMDATPSDLSPSLLTSGDFEGTLDNKKVKYRIVALSIDGEGAVRKFGDESDYDVEDGTGFPPIPPAKNPSRLPKLIHNTHVSDPYRCRLPVVVPALDSLMFRFFFLFHSS